MTPSSTDNIPNQLKFGSIKGRKVIADFTGGRITSDAGIVLMAELDRKLQITSRMLHVFKITEIHPIQITQFINYWHKEFMALC